MDVMWLAFLGLFLLIVLACFFIYSMHKKLQILEQYYKEKVGTLKHELTVVNNAAIGVGQRLINVEKRLKISIEQQQHIQLHSAEHLPYNEAASMAEEGLDVQQLMEQYGLPEAEASLLSLLKSGPGAIEQEK